MRKHRGIYEEHGFETMPLFHSVLQMTRPKFGENYCPKLAEEIRVRLARPRRALDGPRFAPNASHGGRCPAPRPWRRRSTRPSSSTASPAPSG